MPSLNQIAKIIFIALIFLYSGAAKAASLTLTPSAISNTYSGIVSMNITGVTAGQNVYVEKFLSLDGGTNVDSSSSLVQMFGLTDGQASVFTNGATVVTNFNVPGDIDGVANGSITANLYPSFDFQQEFVGTYLFVVFSPTGNFTPLTNTFAVTNFPFPQKITGNVISNGVSATTLSNSVVVLLQSEGGDNTEPVGGVVVNSSGAYSIAVPVGAYNLVAFRTNYVASFATAPSVTVNANATVTTNISIVFGTNTISGRLVHADNTSKGLPGCSVQVQSTDRKYFALGVTDTNGNFNSSVIAEQWKVGPSGRSLLWNGFYLPNNIIVDTTTGSVSGLTFSVPKATAVFYGTVTDNHGNPLPGVALYSQDNSGNYNQMDGYTFTNGQYVAPAVGGLSNDSWQVSKDYGGPANYIYSQSFSQQNGGTNLNFGQAVQENFSGILATNFITGNVSFNGTNVVGVGVDAYTTINGLNYNSYADTDGNGHYSLPVVNSNTWSVSVNCNGGNDSLYNLLGQGNYQCPDNLNTNVAGNNPTVNFVIQPCSGIQMFDASPLPEGTNGDYYSYQFNASSCSGNFNWTVLDPADVPSGLTLYSGGAFNGTPNTSGTFSFTVQVSDGGSLTTNKTFSLTIAPASLPLSITTPTTLPNATNGTFYNLQVQASGGTPPYGWYVPNYSASLPGNLGVSTSGVLSGTVSATVQTYYFYLDVTDSVANFVEEQFTVSVVNPPLAPLVITNVSLPNGNVRMPYSAQLGAAGGQPPYTWQLALGSAPLPSGMILNPAGTISGTPTTNKISAFKVQVSDSISDTTNKVFAIIVNPDPVLGLPFWQTNRLSMLLNAASNQNYTLLMSTNLASTNWISILVTNKTTANSYLIVDPNATNRQRYYRVLIGP